MLENIPLIAAGAGAIGLLIAMYLYNQVNKVKIDNEVVAEITDEIQKGRPVRPTYLLGLRSKSRLRSTSETTRLAAGTDLPRQSAPALSQMSILRGSGGSLEVTQVGI